MKENNELIYFQIINLKDNSLTFIVKLIIIILIPNVYQNIIFMIDENYLTHNRYLSWKPTF